MTADILFEIWVWRGAQIYSIIAHVAVLKQDLHADIQSEPAWNNRNKAVEILNR